MKNVTVYTTNNCGYCDAAKRLLNEKGITFTEINIALDDSKRIELMQKTGQRTLPQIIIDDEFIGGYTELKAFFAKKASE